MADAKKIVCFGDSNTWGACGFSGIRRDKDRRWSGILDMNPAYNVVNYGENGREIPHDDISLGAFKVMAAREAPFDLLIVMLGTNDILNMPVPDVLSVTSRMENFLNFAISSPSINGESQKILLIAPPCIKLGRAYEDYRYDEASLLLGQNYRALAESFGVNFADAAKWNVTPGPDGVHFTEEGHRIFAKALEKELLKIFKIYSFCAPRSQRLPQ